jgi:hypothetical protein
MKITRTGRNSRRITFESPRESVLWVAQMNERNYCYEAAAKLYREQGDEESAKRCEEMLARKNKT